MAPGCRYFFAIAVGAMAAASAPAQVGDGNRPVDIRAGSLSEALAEFARETGAELLFDEKLSEGLRAPGVRGRLSRREVLRRLLAGTGLEFRESGSTFVLFRSGSAGVDPGVADAAVPEILVIGRRTQNADIRRTENDIQPYKVLTSSVIESADRDDVGQLMRSRVASNAQIASPDQLQTIPADTRSAIDLRGLGTLRTLVLVDGRRMPSIPTALYDYEQPDLNGIPLSAIERIETLTGTAGGIHGPSALGGVVNIVLRRDYQGAHLRVVSGISSRGDAATLAVEGRLGFTLNGGRTSVMLIGGARTADPLRRKDRDFGLRQRLLQYANEPTGYIMQRLRLGLDPNRPSSNAVTVFSASGEDLTLDPQFGGGTLGSPYTFLPVGFEGPRDQAVDLLRRNAGQLLFDLPDDLTGGMVYLRSRPSSRAALMNIRHEFGDWIEGYFDGLFLRNEGVLKASSFEILPATVAGAATNPFSQDVFFRFPRVDLFGGFTQKIETSRFSSGLVIQLPGRWRAVADYSAGSTKVERFSRGKVVDLNLIVPLAFGVPGPKGLPVLDPLGPWQEFVASIHAYSATGTLAQPLRNRFADATFRIAGPLLDLPAGALEGTALLEWRREYIPVTQRVLDRPGGVVTNDVPERTQTVRSAYAELRVPLTRSVDTLPLLRNLELQLAARFDHSRTVYPSGFGVALTGESIATRSERGVLTYTAGARLFPVPMLMLRGSVATGELPPTIESLESVSRTSLGNPSLADPRRGNRPLGSEARFRLLYGALPSSRPEHARTISLGFVVNPAGRQWPRLSVDYSEISKKRDRSLLVEANFDRNAATARIPALLAGEARTPDRILRAPLSEKDRALGFTGGVVTEVDARTTNNGRSILRVVDLQLDWRASVGSTSQLRIYGSGTWQPTFRRRASSEAEWIETAGFADGPIKWRGNGGVEWMQRGISLGLNAQYYGSYSPRYSAPSRQGFNTQILSFQGGDRIPPQLYLDVSARRRFELPRARDTARGMEVGLGIVNLLDKSPPITADIQTPGYSYYGDPRRRRLVLTLSTSF